MLVTSAEKGQLGVSDVDLRALKRKVAEILQQPGADEDKSSCIELLSQLDPENLNEVLVSESAHPVVRLRAPRQGWASLDTTGTFAAFDVTSIAASESGSAARASQGGGLK
ncbi:MAG: hypothetical protein GDA43_05410 [Hormoscilla sp. SP5CHS1]|nr:hypothetical protein [Hormoscilla sp. SP12CHS1]MBC6452697.1 hypothetical protein [Hormoscilla sp. SP5CHS1]